MAGGMLAIYYYKKANYSKWFFIMQRVMPYLLTGSIVICFAMIWVVKNTPDLDTYCNKKYGWVINLFTIKKK